MKGRSKKNYEENTQKKTKKKQKTKLLEAPKRGMLTWCTDYQMLDYHLMNSLLGIFRLIGSSTGFHFMWCGPRYRRRNAC